MPFFHSIIGKWNKPYLPHHTPIEDKELKSITIELNDVTSALQQLDPSKAPRPDAIPARILKDSQQKCLIILSTKV